MSQKELNPFDSKGNFLECTTKRKKIFLKIWSNRDFCICKSLLSLVLRGGAFPLNLAGLEVNVRLNPTLKGC